MNTPHNKLRENARKMHQDLHRDLQRGEPKAVGMFAALGAEMNAAKKSLGLPPTAVEVGEEAAVNYPKPLPQRKDCEVNFAPPKAVDESLSRRGRVLDAISVGPVKDDDWGWYIYFSELIEWQDAKKKSIRLAYYYAPFGSKRWLWGGQYSIEESPLVIKELLEKTLEKKDWFALATPKTRQSFDS